MKMNLLEYNIWARYCVAYYFEELAHFHPERAAEVAKGSNEFETVVSKEEDATAPKFILDMLTPAYLLILKMEDENASFASMSAAKQEAYSNAWKELWPIMCDESQQNTMKNQFKDEWLGADPKHLACMQQMLNS